MKVPKPRWYRDFTFLFLDYFDTWAAQNAPKRRSLMVRKGLFVFGTPTALGALTLRFPFELNNAGLILTAVSILAALLFGLLVAVFDAAVSFHSEPTRLRNAHGLEETLSDFRAVITYEIFIAILLLAVLLVALATMPADSVALAAAWTTPLVWLGSHFLLVLSGILRLFRTAFNYLSR